MKTAFDFVLQVASAIVLTLWLVGSVSDSWMRGMAWTYVVIVTLRVLVLIVAGLLFVAAEGKRS